MARRRKPGSITAAALAGKLRRAVRTYLPGSALPGHSELARQFDTTLHTVRKALVLLARQGLVQARPRAGTIVLPQPTEIAFDRIAAIVHGVDSLAGFQQLVVRGVERRAAHYGLRVETRTCPSEHAAVGRIVGDASDRYAYVFVNLVPSDDHLAAWRIRGLPFVAVDDTSQSMKINTVCFDVQQAIYNATDMLLRLGHRRVAYVGHVSGRDAISVARLRGYRLAQLAHGLSPDPRLQVESKPNAMSACRKLLSKSSGPSAIVAADVPAGCAAIEACDLLGLRIPQQISVISAGARRLDIPPQAERLSRFDQGSPEQLGQLAVDVLVQNSPADDPVRLVLGSQWVDRGSVGPPAG